MGLIEKVEKLDDVMAYYLNVREALSGLTEIMNINFNEKGGTFIKNRIG